MRYVAFVISILGMIVFSIGSAHAQMAGVSGTMLNPSQIMLSPAYPSPGSTVTAALNDYSVDTSGASITWYLNGNVIPAFANKRSISFTVGAIGSQTTVTAVTALSGGGTLTASAVAQVVRVDMLVEADTIAPPFYRGRTIPAVGSVIHVTALPFLGTGALPSSYAYTWTVNGSVMNGGAIAGQNSISFTTGFERAADVSVSVIDNGTIVASNNISIPLQKPKLLFYRVDALRGISDEAMTNPYQLTDNEITVRAEPYFIDRSLLTQNPYLAWKLNGNDLQNQSTDPQDITLRKTASTTGSFALDFHIRNLQQLLQGVESSINITF